MKISLRRTILAIFSCLLVFLCNAGNCVVESAPIQAAAAISVSPYVPGGEVFYMTDRAPKGKSYGRKRYYAEQGVIYGKVDFDNHGKAERPDALSQKVFYEELGRQLSLSKAGEIAVFVHGFNNSFEIATKEGYRLSKALGCPVVVFDWCSVHRLFGYISDECNAEWSLLHYEFLMTGLENHFQAGHIMIISHSMGNRIVNWYLQSRYDTTHGTPSRFSEVVMTSPDIDRATLKNFFYKVAHNARVTRVYVSARDRLLWLSGTKFLNGYERGGDGRIDKTGETRGWEYPGALKGTETINFTKLDKNLRMTGHTIQAKLIANMHKTGKPGPGLALKNDPQFGCCYRYVIKLSKGKHTKQANSLQRAQSGN